MKSSRYSEGLVPPFILVTEGSSPPSSGVRSEKPSNESNPSTFRVLSPIQKISINFPSEKKLKPRYIPHSTIQPGFV